jgi:uncharacterized protein DUF5681
MSNEPEKAAANLPPGPQPAANVDAAKHTYEVGFGKPPKAGQFKKGASGNPKGRPKRGEISDVAPLIEGIFAEPIKVREGEQIRTISNLEAMLHAQVRHALQGNPKAIRTVFDLGAKAGLFSKTQRKSFIEIIEPEGEAGKILRGYQADKARQANVTDAGRAVNPTRAGTEPNR